MKTLVIHPADYSTNFLRGIYSGRGWTVINTNTSKKFLKEQIKAHDRIVMLGHGTEKGLLGFKKFVIDSTWVYLLREKNCVCIWCNADVFVKKYDLKGFYTGMIISEYDEALMFCLHHFTSNDITESNTLFTESIKNAIDSENMFESVISQYTTEKNSIIDFNKQNIFIK